MVPLEVISGQLGGLVQVVMRNGRVYYGVLRAYDEHVNMVLDEMKEAAGSALVDRGLSILNGNGAIMIQGMDGGEA